MKLFIKSFGCQMSVADAEEMSSPLLAQGWKLVENLKEADAAVLNTCTVRQHAEDKAISMIGRMADWKERRPGRLVIVAGCVAQRLGPSIQKKFPHVDLVIGAKSVEQYPKLLEQALRERFDWKKEDGPHPSDLLCRWDCARGSRPARCPPRSKVSSYVTIMRGCNYACSYCIVPLVRGKELSRPLESILKEVREKTKEGAREIILLGQTVNSYRSPESRDFAHLLDALDEVPGLKRLRFMSPHPRHLSDRMTQAMARSATVCRHLHLPLQSGSNRILKAMRRNYTASEYLKNIERLRRVMPDLAITTDAIVGFPGETETDFEHTLDALRQIDPASTYCFKFSPRPGTPADKLDDDVPRAVKEERLRRLLELVDARMQAHMAAWLGKKVQVLLEDKRFGRTRHFFKTILDKAEKPGELVDCLVIGRTKTSLLVKKDR